MPPIPYSNLSHELCWTEIIIFIPQGPKSVLFVSQGSSNENLVKDMCLTDHEL